MVGTRTTIAEQQERFKKVIVDILQIPKDCPIIQAFDHESISTINNILMLNDVDIDPLEYIKNDEEMSDNNHRETLARGHRGWIRVLIAFIRYCDFETEKELEEITIDIFNNYRLKIYNPMITTDSSTNHTNKINTKGSHNDGEYFKRGTKRDKSQYPVLKFDWQWDDWIRTTVSTAKTHLCHGVFDLEYVPKTKEEKSEFEAKQEFTYSVFQVKLQTDVGNYSVRLYYKTGNAQQIYKEQVDHAKTSTHAQLESSE